MRWISTAILISACAAIALIDHLPHGTGLLLVLVAVVSIQIENVEIEMKRQRSDIVKLAEMITLLVVTMMEDAKRILQENDHESS